VSRAWQVDRIFKPQMSADQAGHRRSRWKQALERSRDWEEQTTVKVAPEL
jgi:glycerol kinase